MSLTFGFYNSINGDRVYDAIQMGQIFDGIITDGIYATYLKAMVVKASDNPSEVIVQPGRAWFNHTWTYIDADYPVEAPAPEVILDRVDTLVLDVNAEYSDRENKILWVQGTPASVNPEAPALINTVTHHQYPLCNVYRKAGTTMIYAADITNRVGTSATPFVTGVLTGINIDDLLSQWDDEFHTWENATKTSFEGWMVNQQSVYTTWFESIRTQMSDDLESFEEWFETIRGIIDEEAATHLQAEIDELKDMLPAGSHIDISTNETTLFNRNVTVSDGVHSKTVQFNAVGGATVESFPYIGAISVTSTDGERTAQETINIPYFGRYSVVLAFWSATVNLVGDSAVGGVPVTVKDSDDLTITTIVLDASGSGTFTATKPDTYKFIYTYGGQTMETTLQVTQETTYEVEIHGGLNYQAWLTAGRVSKTFSSLDEILADEETLRQLFLVHDSVDYIASQTVNTDVTKIFNTDLAAKWINNSDYALDHFYAVADIKTVMDTADKYGYGEWVITDDTTTSPTWGAKGNVPVMTANNAPYGEAFVKDAYSGMSAYFAFRGPSSSGGVHTSNYNTTVDWHCGYKFTNPVCVKSAYIITTKATTGTSTCTYKIQASNDNSTWIDISSVKTVDITYDQRTYTTFDDISNNDFYLYYRVFTNGIGVTILSLQFYGRELKVSVPVMTSNTAPFGEAFASSAYSTWVPWKAFNGTVTNESDAWIATSKTNEWIAYDFLSPMIVKMISIQNRTHTDSNGRIHTFKLQGSNTRETTDWHDIGSVVDRGNAANASAYKSIHNYSLNDVSYRYIRVYILTDFTDGSYTGTGEMQFWGLDYSEKEFEEGTTKKWLYDHGVELEEITINQGASGGIAIKRDNEIYLKSRDGGTSGVVKHTCLYATLDLTPYSIAMLRVGNELTKGTETPYRFFAISVGSFLNTETGVATKNVKEIEFPNYLSISAVNESNNVGVMVNNTNEMTTVTELWLE